MRGVNVTCLPKMISYPGHRRGHCRAADTLPRRYYQPLIPLHDPRLTYLSDCDLYSSRPSNLYPGSTLQHLASNGRRPRSKVGFDTIQSGTADPPRSTLGVYPRCHHMIIDSYCGYRGGIQFNSGVIACIHSIYKRLNTNLSRWVIWRQLEHRDLARDVKTLSSMMTANMDNQ